MWTADRRYGKVYATEDASDLKSARAAFPKAWPIADRRKGVGAVHCQHPLNCEARDRACACMCPDCCELRGVEPLSPLRVADPYEVYGR
jgi:hypothetical protein